MSEPKEIFFYANNEYYANNVDDYFRKVMNDRNDVVNAARFYKDIVEAEAVIISDRDGKYGGTVSKTVDYPISGKINYDSVFIRFVSGEDAEGVHPHTSAPDPLKTNNLSDFLTTRSKFATRAVLEKGLLSYIGIPQYKIGNTVRCRLIKNIWYIQTVHDNIHPSWNSFKAVLKGIGSGALDIFRGKPPGFGAGGPGANQSTRTGIPPFPPDSPGQNFEEDLRKKITGLGLPFQTTDRSRTVDDQMQRITNKYYGNGAAEVVRTYGARRGAAMVRAIESGDQQAFRKLAARSSGHLGGLAMDIRSYHYTNEQMTSVLAAIRELGGNPLVEPITRCWESSGRDVTTTQRINNAKPGGNGRGTRCHNEHIHIDIPENYGTNTLTT